MQLALLARKIHKWIFLFIGLQVLLWVASGFYMVVMNLDFIHGDHLVRNLREPLPQFSQELFPTAQLMAGRTAVKSVELKAIRGKPFYVVRDSNGAHLHDAYSGDAISPLDQSAAIALAEYYFTGDQPAARAQLLTDNPPAEIPARILPIWRIDFDDQFGTSFYIDPNTGALVTRRHDYWRAFDFLWMLHIMDYEERADVHNSLLFYAAMFSLTSVLAGLLLLFYSFGTRRKPQELQ